MDSTEPPPVVIESPVPAPQPPARTESPAPAAPPQAAAPQTPQTQPLPALPPGGVPPPDPGRNLAPVGTENAAVGAPPPPNERPRDAALVYPSPALEHPPPGARTVELGVGTFLLAGVGSSGVVGLSPFVTDSLSEAVFLRISVAVGESPQSVMRMTWAAGRLDTCLAVPGHYAERNGLRLDLCGGLDAGFTYISSATLPDAPHEGQTLPYVAVGPSVDLRGDIGANAAVTLRGVLGLNVTRGQFVDATGSRVDAPIGSERLELSFSWKVQ